MIRPEAGTCGPTRRTDIHDFIIQQENREKLNGQGRGYDCKMDTRAGLSFLEE